MKFPWSKYIEIPSERRNTLQVFITNVCNLRCEGCFARKIMGDSKEAHNIISIEEYREAIYKFIDKGGEQVNLLGGEPLTHIHLPSLIHTNIIFGLKTTIYTNGYFLENYERDCRYYLDEYLKTPDKDLREEFKKVKMRVSLYSNDSGYKKISNIPTKNVPFEGNFMVSSKTTLDELLDVARCLEKDFKTKVFFISSLRELDNDRREFFDDTPLTMPIIGYKELVHRFLDAYEGNMDIHVSSRGVFQSTLGCGYNKCRFSNYFVGGKTIQCPYDIVNLEYQDDYEFDKRHCQHNSTCLMTKVIYRKRK
jgi:organic radical activating enzyme